MADETGQQTPPTPPPPAGARPKPGGGAPPPDGKGPFGLPMWAAVAGGTVVLVTAYLMWRKRQLAASQAASNSNTGAQTGPTYVGGATDASAFYSMLQGLQGQLSNLNAAGNSKAPQWASWSTGSESLNDLAQALATTPAAIIANTTSGAAATGGLDPSVQQYFDAGNYDDMLPLGSTLAVPVAAANHPPGGTDNGPLGQIDQAVAQGAAGY